MAFQLPGVQVLGLTTIFGNCATEHATRNALILASSIRYIFMTNLPLFHFVPSSLLTLAILLHLDSGMLTGGKPDVADFVHGSEGLGNIELPDPTIKKVEESAAEFLVDKVSQFPGEVSVFALGPLTNVALVCHQEGYPSFVKNVKKIVVLGGAFFSAGNATPSAEANIHHDPEAADIVFTSGADIYVVGLNITTQVSFTDKDLLELRNSKGKHAQFLCDVCKFYLDWHIKSYGAPVIFPHDPVSFAALVCPEMFTFKKGVVRVETQGICVGHTSMDMLLNKWNSENPWTGYSPISVAWTVDVPKVVEFVKELVIKQ
ncbi:unnamed protein product [Miscanthus lutarioriparius]|uniref:Inosine/uridine-preferring nucleoside hydrolase domain-containing protein n=1 Tax=Miscanthus lutarioriparius TaxID=422564 RepID=A0A811NE90_9POAL|nr:unnamed protein product [Miscanthus lutarioriparius]